MSELENESKAEDYVILPRYYMQDKSLSLKAKGLLTVMLSCDKNTDFTIKGLSDLCKEGTTCVRTTMKELEDTGYIVRQRIRDKGQYLSSECKIVLTVRTERTGICTEMK